MKYSSANRHCITAGLAFAALTLSLSSCRPRAFHDSKTYDSWNAGTENIPNVFERYGQLEYNFDKLKQRPTGELEFQPWSDTFWPSGEGGITVRWRHQDAVKRFGYQSPHTPEEIDAMSNSDINMLSPAEKFDIITGGYRKGWPMWRREAQTTTSCPTGVGIAESTLPMRERPKGADWQGKCHAWTPASLQFPEPGTADTEIQTPGGIKQVHFGSSDIKALLVVSYDMFVNQYPDYARAGTRCGSEEVIKGEGSTIACLDTNSGTFFVLATNLLQKGKPGFVVDNDPRLQVWNQPAWKYEHRFLGDSCPIEIKNRANPKGTLAHVATDLHWIAELDASETPHGTKNQVRISSYEYCVEMDENRNVVGGEWISWLRPDFIWMTGKPDLSKPVQDTLTGATFDFSKLMELYQKSRGG